MGIVDAEVFEAMRERAEARLWAARDAEGCWRGRLSSSALATATAVFALALVDRERYAAQIGRGLEWLAKNGNADGGWGDTAINASNLSTTALVWAAATAGAEGTEVGVRAEAWLRRQAGGVTAAALGLAIKRRYGQDRSFSAPILAMCALSGQLGPGKQAWETVSRLPFEWALCPRRWLKWFRLPVVSYALPALIAIGQLGHRYRLSGNPLVRRVRDRAAERTWGVLEEIQPSSGGFLEAVPLTSFVVMSLAGLGRKEYAVTQRGVAFLLESMQVDGSWPIDSDLATWLTTLAVNVLAAGGHWETPAGKDERDQTLEWLLRQQFSTVHPYTYADAGGWAWTDRAGGVPDADDTAGALVALHHLGANDERVRKAAEMGVGWLVNLQNRDGGIPTFCRGWGKLPFDRSAADLTAHVLRAGLLWRSRCGAGLRGRINKALGKGLAYLGRVQQDEGAWQPLWFGNQGTEDDINWTYGTARVVSALAEMAEHGVTGFEAPTARGVVWLISAQNADGGWGGGEGTASSIEETALSLEALGRVARAGDGARTKVLGDWVREDIFLAVRRGVRWLIERTNAGRDYEPAGIGLYFARLWYYEGLYPVIFTVAALEQIRAIRGIWEE